MKRVLVFILLTCGALPAVFAVIMAPSLPSEPSLQDKNKAVAMRMFEEILNQGKFQVADEIYATDFVNHGLHRNADLREDQAAARWWKETAPDLTVTVNMMMADGDLVTVLWTARANTISVWGLPAMHAKFEDRGITIWRIVNGKIREEWSAFDLLRIVRQIVRQLKWQLMGLLCVLVILIWLVGRFVRKLWLTHSARGAKATS